MIGAETKVKEMTHLQLRLRDMRKTLSEDGYNNEFCQTLNHAIDRLTELAELARERDELMAALEKLSRLGNEPLVGNSIGNKIALDAILKAQGYKS